MKISVIILTLNRKGDLEEALNSLYDQDFTDYEVIVVDNGSDDGTTQMVNSKFPQIKYIKLDENIGAKALKVGAKKARGEIIVNLDNDSLLDRNALSNIWNQFEKNEKLGALSAKVVDYYSGEIYDPWHWFSKAEHESNNLLPITFINGNGASFRKSVLEEVNYFSDTVFFYGWEMDLSLRVICAGYEVMYCPGIEVRHKMSGASRSKDLSIFYITRNGLWYYFRYFPISCILKEIPKNLLYYAAISIKKKSFLYYLKGVVSAFYGLPRILKERQPIKEDKIKRVKGKYDVWNITKIKIKEALSKNG